MRNPDESSRAKFEKVSEMGRLVHIGEKATEEMLAAKVRNPVFDRAAAIAAKRAGLSDEQIIDLLGYPPPSTFEDEQDQGESGGSESIFKAG